MSTPGEVTLVSSERLLSLSPFAGTDVPGEFDAAMLRGWWGSLSDRQFESVWVAQVVEMASDGIKVGSLANVLATVRDRYRAAGAPAEEAPGTTRAGTGATAAKRDRRLGESRRGLVVLRDALARPGVPPEGIPSRATLLKAGMCGSTVQTAINAARLANDLDVHKPDRTRALYVRQRPRTPGEDR